MNLRNCPECGKIFLQGVSDLCPNCLNEEEEDYKKVKEYLIESKVFVSTVDELHEKTGVAGKRIAKFIRQGRLANTNVRIGTNCEGCGTHIDEGRYCASCRAKMLKGFNGQETPEAGKSSSVRGKGMFTADLTDKHRR